MRTASLLQSWLLRHRWFMRESYQYLGHDDFVRAYRRRWPLVRAWCCFMWLSRRDKPEYWLKNQ